MLWSFAFNQILSPFTDDRSVSRWKSICSDVAMIYSICGAALVAVGAGSFWHLLPSGGRIHPLAKDASVASMLTIGIMIVVMGGVAFLTEGAFQIAHFPD
jgi:hypothetical protein